MQASPVSPTYRLLRAIGSLWFAAVLLVLLLLSLACATVYESIHSTEYALSAYYRATWFTTLLALLSINVLAAIILRFPFSKWRIGFVMTHSAILLIFTGALITRYFAEDGQLALAEGQSSDQFVLRDSETLTVFDRKSGQGTSIDLDPAYVGGLRTVVSSAIPAIKVGDLTIQVEQYVPDSEVVEQMRDDNPLLRPAVELSIAAGGHRTPLWVFPNQRATSGSIPVSFRIVRSAEELTTLLKPSAEATGSGPGRVRIEYQGQTVERPVEECLTLPIAIGDTGLSFRVLRFMPHATVGANNQITNTSDKPLNPAIEVEIAGGEEVETRLAFAKYPGFASMHKDSELADLKVTHLFEAGVSPPLTPVEVLRGPQGDLYARFAGADGEVTVTPIQVDEAVNTPWSGRQLVVHRSIDHARFEHTFRPIDPPTKERSPGIELRLTTGDSSDTVWLQKDRPLPITVNRKPYELGYTSKTVPLGFTIKLDSFRVGYYPGEQRPRSFESRVTITDAAGGGALSRLISMNHPTDYGRYTFFQSSYQLDGNRRITILSVSRDPGTVIVFAGHGLMICGMIVVLFTRTRQQRQALPGAQGISNQSTPGEFRIDLLHAEQRCTGGGGEHDTFSSALPRSGSPHSVAQVEKSSPGVSSR